MSGAAHFVASERRLGPNNLRPGLREPESGSTIRRGSVGTMGAPRTPTIRVRTLERAAVLQDFDDYALAMKTAIARVDAPKKKARLFRAGLSIEA